MQQVTRQRVGGMTGSTARGEGGALDRGADGLPGRGVARAEGAREDENLSAAADRRLLARPLALGPRTVGAAPDDPRGWRAVDDEFLGFGSDRPTRLRRSPPGEERGQP